MVDFRRCITALAALALFAGVAAAQFPNGSGGVLTCATNVSVTPSLRAEGYTEETGDVTLTCTGGVAAAAGSAIPTVNITVFLNTAVTSRLFTSSAPLISEALLLIDEPGSGLAPIVAGFGPAAGQNVCSSPTTGASTGCPQVVTNLTTAGVVCPAGTPGCFAVSTDVGSTTIGRNVFQGIVNGNSVTWFGVPVLPPVTTGVSRVYRFTNIRANATTLSGGSAAGATPVIASISISGSTSLLITNPTPTVGFVQSGLTTSVSTTTAFTQCNSSTRAFATALNFSENFGTAFKTRVAPSAGQFSGQGTNTGGTGIPQNVPGQIYNSESNFILPIGSNTAGLADFGTRLKATFSNIGVGTRIFVSVNNVVNAITGPSVAAPTPPGGPSVTAFAQLVSSETGNDGSSGVAFFPAVAATDNAAGTGGTVGIAEIPVVNGSAVAVWEVINTNPAAQESFKFGVYSTFVSNVAQNSPPPGTASVNLSFAPTPPAFTASSGAAASSSLTIPRFIADPNAAKSIFTINICRTILLYPFVTNQAGFDTGLAIANTSTDPFGTGPQAGACQLNWYGGTTPPAPTTSGSIASGTVFTTLASLTVTGFQGYMIAVCNFQYAHGFAFISDLGAQKLAMGYLAVVIPDPANNSGRAASDASKSAAGSGENDAH